MAKELEKIHKEMNKKLILIGLTKDELIPEYECKNCEDTGYISGQMCTCLKNKLTQRLISEFGAKDQNLHSFKSFDATLAKTDEHKSQLLKLKKKFEQIISSFPSNDCPNFVILYLF